MKFIPKPPTQLMGLLAAFLLMLLIPASYTHATTSSFSCDDVSQIPQSECEALVALHNSTNGPNWVDNTGWLESNTPCSWYGLDCEDASVVSISLGSNSLSGTLPPQIGDFTNLRDISLVSNTLSGSIPAELGNLANLETLYLHNNLLGGTIPPELGNLSNLRVLDLSVTRSNGSIPLALGNLTNLQTLNLQGNGLSGSIPSSLGNLRNLQALRLNSNLLSGSIPPELGQLSNLQTLYLYTNRLSGSIPPELGNLSALRNLSLSENQLSGSIPPELGNLSNLRYLYLSTNQLSGSIPTELGNLSSLVYLYLYSNQLSGSVPPELGNLSSLTRFYLHANQLSGTIPPELGYLGNLEILYLHDNQLSGTIPSTLGNLSRLYYLYLSSNQLSGTIPPELGEMTRLQQLYLHVNQLSGTIPLELGNLSKLRYLYLYDNQLSGTLPPTLGNLSQLQHLRINSNPLSGDIPLSFTSLGSLQSFYFHLTTLCEPDDAAFQTWLDGVAQVIGTGAMCGADLPEMSLTPSSFEVSVLEGSSSSRTLIIGNSGTAELMWNLTSDAAWLTAMPASGTVAADESGAVTVDLDASGLALGDYSGALTISSNDPDETSVEVPVSLTVTDTLPMNVIAITPDNARVNEDDVAVMISGTHFQAPVTAALGGVDLLNVTLETSSTLSAVVPVGSLGEGMYDLSVQSNGQTSTLADAFTVLPAEPVIFSLSPSTVIVGAGDTFTLTLEIQAGTQQVDGASAYLNFESPYLQVTNITLGDTLPLEIQNEFDNTNGEVNIAAGAINNFPTGTFTLATVTFQAQSELTETEIEFNSTMPRISDITFGGQSVMDQLVGSTVNIENATLDGFVTLQGRPAPPDPRWSVPLSVTFTIPGESTPAYSFTPTTDENGHFSVAGIEPGTYEVRVKKSTTLRNLVTVTLGAGYNSVDLGTLLEGDANNDNNVTLIDFSILVSTFAKCEGDPDYDPQADFNGDGCVTIHDFSLLASNFAQGGDIEPTFAPIRLAIPTGDAVLIIDQPIIQAETLPSSGGKTYRVTVRLEADSPVDGVAAYIDFDPSLLKVKRIIAGDTFDLVLQNEFDNQNGMIHFAAGTFSPLPPQNWGGLRGGFDLLVIEFEALADGESPLLFQFDAPRTTDVTSGGESVLSDYVDGSNSSTPTAVEVAQLAAHKPVTTGWMALLLMGALLLIGVGRRWIGSR